MAHETDPIHEEAKALLRTRRYGTLATASAKHDQWPFASIMPYGLMANGSPIIYVAGIAEHTKNLKANPRASLFVHPEAKADEDIQTHARLTLMVEAKPVDRDQSADAWARYLCRLPDAQGYTRAHDFELWQLEPVRARYIGGFGRIYWLERDAVTWNPTQDGLQSSAQGIIDHMNDDHEDAMQLLWKVHFGDQPGSVKMVAVDQFGFDVKNDKTQRRFEFKEPATGENIRALMVDLVKDARSRTPATAEAPSA
ncbi:MAG: pyridoxamine 5'-phosphate oxidase family protein [Myxococcota bacterium]